MADLGKMVKCVNKLCKGGSMSRQEGRVECSDCKTGFYVLCHQFPAIYHKNLQCSKCQSRFYFFHCSKCTSLVVARNHRVGTLLKCHSCGDETKQIICGCCYGLTKINVAGNPEGKPIKCSKCQGGFEFLTCNQCLHPIYSSAFKAGDEVLCVNMKCKSVLKARMCLKCKSLYACPSKGPVSDHFCFEGISQSQAPWQHNPYETRNNQLPLQAKGLPSLRSRRGSILDSVVGSESCLRSDVRNMQLEKSKEDSQCKVCFGEKACFINNKCFHLTVCQGCVPKNGMCPVCRKQGDYMKVYT